MSDEHKLFLKKKTKKKKIIFIFQILIFVIFISLWQLLSNFNLINTFIFSSPKKILETIISELESDTINLDDSIEKYTKAIKLVKECDEKLKNVEEQVSKIVAENGELKDFKEEE